MAKHSELRQSKQSIEIARVGGGGEGGSRRERGQEGGREGAEKGETIPPAGQSQSGETFTAAIGLVLTATHLRIDFKKKKKKRFLSKLAHV